MKTIFLFPGQLAVADEPTMLSTMLGSCVGVALWDRHTHVGGLNHYLLSNTMRGETPSPRYGSFAIPELIESCLRAGAAKRDLVARVFGGAAVLGQVSVGQKIGESNIALALRLLGEAGIPILEQQTGGDRGCKIVFNTATGEVQHLLNGERGKEVDVTGFGAIPAALESQPDIRVLIVDDSVTVRRLFERIFTKAGLTVVGSAANAYEARELVVSQNPDVMTLDIEMPQINGVQFLEKIMQHKPMPVVMVSSFSHSGEAALESLRLGAVEFVQKPSQTDPAQLSELGQMLVAKVRAAASAKLLTARPTVKASTSPPKGFSLKGQVAGIFVSGNTGAPKSVTKMLANFTNDSPPVVFAVSTLSPFLHSFIADMKKKTSIDLRIANENTLLSRGVAYFLPEGKHGVISRVAGQQLQLAVSAGAPISNQLPSGDRLLESAAAALGPAAVGILLSGFGTDGIKGLAAIQSCGGYTLAENPSEAGFPFVPQGAIAQGFVADVISVEQIFATILSHRERGAA